MLTDIAFLACIPEVEQGFDVSPDGEWVAYISNHSGRYEVYRVNLITRMTEQLTSDGIAKTAPKFSPDGRSLLFAQDHQGDECWDFFLIDLSTHSTRLVLRQWVAGYANASWSPDGKSLLITTAVNKRFSVCWLDVVHGTLQPLSHHRYADGYAEFSPNGIWLAFDANTNGQDHAIFLMHRDGSHQRQLPHEAANPRWSPDGKWVLFHSNSRGSEDVGLYDLVNGQTHWLTHSPWDEWTACWSPDGHSLAYIKNEDSAHTVQIRHAKDGAIVASDIAPSFGVIEQVQFAREGHSVVFHFSNHALPPSLWEYNIDSRTMIQITPVSDGIDPDQCIQPYVVRYAAKDDPALQIPALVYPARDASQNTPGIVLIHGGPTWAWANFWAPAAQHFAQLGYSVLCPNYRGSTGYGRAFQIANRYDIGRGDVLDCIAGADYLIAQGLAQCDKLGVTGTSQGGYMTMMCLSKHPEYWAAGSAIVGFFNYFTEYATEREDLRYWDLQNMGDPTNSKDAERYKERSPIFFIDQVRAPVQLFAGRQDPRCPAAETEQVYEALLKRNIDVELRIYENEGHGFSHVENRIDAYLRRSQFFDRILHK